MKLTKEQQDMLDGKYGKGTALAMKIQVAIGVRMILDYSFFYGNLISLSPFNIFLYV